MAESRNQRVLIVDNNEEESNRLGVMLQRAGYDSMATWSGLEALELMKSEVYDILLVSSYLPDVYVGDFFERLKRLPVRPCSIVMQEGCIPAVTLREIKKHGRGRKIASEMKAAECGVKQRHRTDSLPG